jgi:ketosteroid isomerase-like protein
MQRFHLKRWLRILIVLSVFWVIVGGTWGWRHAYDQADANFKLCVAAIHSAADLQSCRAERARALAVPRGVIAAAVAIAPLAVFWLIIFGLVRLARRMRGSFNPRPGPVAAAASPASVLNAQPADDLSTNQNKCTVERYMDAFRRSDRQEILSCLTDDVEWVLPGLFRIKGKEAFDREIENPAFVGSPVITVTRITEENNVVVAEGRVRAARRDGGSLHAVFCDVFEMRDAKIRRLVSYLMEIKDA